MSEWITDRLPDPDDAPEDWVFVSEHGIVQMFLASFVRLGMPWQPIVPPAPYVKPKRWTVKYNDGTWVLIDHRLQRSYFVGLWELGPNGGDAAQRIADAYNEVMP
jgi:hypothetical protein